MPDTTAVHTDAALTNFAVSYPTATLIAPRLLPAVPVQHRSDVYYVVDAARERERLHNDLREPGDEAHEIDWTASTSPYLCEGHALKSLVADEDVANADEVLRAYLNQTEFLMQAILINQEHAAATLLAAGVTNTSDPTNEWDDYTDGDPFADMTIAINSVEDNTGHTPNVIAMDGKVWRAVKNHPDIIDRIKYTGTNTDPADVSPRAFAELFDLEEVIVGSVLYNSSIKGQAASMSRVWGSDVYVAYRAPNLGPKVDTLGVRFVWSPVSAKNGWLVRKWRSDERRGHVIEVSGYYDPVVIDANCAYRLQNRIG